MSKASRFGIRVLALAGGFLLASIGQAQYNTWCENPIPPCDPNASQSICYQPPEPDPRCGEEQCENCRKSPCYVGTGSYEMATVDLSIRTNGFPLRTTRRYDSTHGIDGPLGKGWTVSVVARLHHAVYLFAAPSTYQKEVFVQMPEGGRYRFVDDGSGTFTPPFGRHDALVRNGDGTWSLTLQRTRSLYRFDATGALTSMTDDYGNQLTVAYDGNGRVQQVADASGSGRYLNVVWGPDGRISTVQDSSGRQIQYAYNAQGALSTVTNPSSQVTSYSYATGRFGPLLSQIKDHWNRVITAITYDTKDRVTSYTDKGETYTYTYNYQGNPVVTAKTDSVGNRYVYPFGAAGLVSDVTPPSGGGGATHTDYDPDGSIQQFTDGVGAKTFYVYNTQGNPLSITRDYQGPTAVRFEYTYDTGFPEKVAAITPRTPATNQIDPDWQAARYDYYPPGSPAPGALHHLYRVRDDGMTTDTLATYEYDAKGRLTRGTSPTGGITDYTYDAVGNLATMTAPSNNDAGSRPVTTFGYDAAGRVTSVTDPLDHVTTYTYDPLDRILAVTLPKPSPSSQHNFQTAYTYDNFDASTDLVFVHITDPNGRLTKQGYNQFGQVARSVDPSGNATSYAYTRGLLTGITDANGNTTAYSYDAARRLVGTTFPTNASEQYTYTGDGLLYQKTDRRNQTLTYAYDRFKRLTQKTYPGSASIAYTYQGQKLTQATDTSATPTDTELYTYDSSYRLVSETQGNRGTINYQYNSDDTVAGYSIQSGPSAVYTYYPDGSLNRIVWSPVSGEFRYTYSLAGQYQRVTFPNGQYRDFSYDDQGRLTGLTNTQPNAGNLAAFTLGYDFNHATGAWDRLGQRTTVSASIPAQGLTSQATNYEYDPLYQLSRIAYPSPAPFNGELHSWTYDAVGNRLTSTINGITQTSIYQKIGTNPLNWHRLLSDGTNSYTYDANGNTATRSGPSGSVTLTWNPDDRLTGISGGVTASYTYDHEGRRTARTAGPTNTYFYDGINPVREIGSTTADFLFGPGIDEPLAMSRGGTVSYYTMDPQGSINLLTDSLGSVQNSYSYDAWGVTRSSTTTTANPLGYTARETGDAGLTFFRARYQDPSTGRFISEDPVRLRWPDLHPYRFNRNNPLHFADPLGTYTTTAECYFYCSTAVTTFCELAFGFPPNPVCWIPCALTSYPICDIVCNPVPRRPDSPFPGRPAPPIPTPTTPTPPPGPPTPLPPGITPPPGWTPVPMPSAPPTSTPAPPLMSGAPGQPFSPGVPSQPSPLVPRPSIPPRGLGGR